MTDRNWSIAVGVGKNFWLGRIRKRASPAENQEEKLRESIACENSHLAGPRPLYFTQNTRKTPKSTFPKLKGDRCTSSRTLNQRRLELWVGGRAECEPRATPLSTRTRVPLSRLQTTFWHCSLTLETTKKRLHSVETTKKEISKSCRRDLFWGVDA